MSKNGVEQKFKLYSLWTWHTYINTRSMERVIVVRLPDITPLKRWSCERCSLLSQSVVFDRMTMEASVLVWWPVAKMKLIRLLTAVKHWKLNANINTHTKMNNWKKKVGVTIEQGSREPYNCVRKFALILCPAANLMKNDRFDWRTVAKWMKIKTGFPSW